MDGSPGPRRCRFFSTLAVVPFVVGSVLPAAHAADGVASSRVDSASSQTRRSATAGRRYAARSSTRPVAYGMLGPEVSARSYVPRHERSGGVQMVSGPTTEVLPEGTVVEGLDGHVVVEGGGFAGGCGECAGGCGECAGGCGECGDCGGPCQPSCGCATCCLIPCPAFSWDNLEISLGVQGFTGPANRGETGSFGFFQAVNWGTPVFNGALGFQAGFRAVETNFEGASFTPDQRNQGFLTGGLFRRVDWGLQGGIVVDHLRDDWYYTADLVQIRGEVSWLFPCRHEIGFWFTSGTQNDEVESRIDDEPEPLDETLRVTDLYAFFYSHRFNECNGTEGRLFAGFTGQSDGLIGAEFRSALKPDLALTADFTYLVPDTPAGGRDHVEEAWNVAIGLTWYPGRHPGGRGNYYEPLFNVASNGTFLFDRE